MRVTVVIPVYNEAGAIARLLAELPPGVAHQVLVVDGGSRDGTQAAAEAAGATVLAQRGRGYGAACLTGAQDATGEVVVFLDGDYSDPPSALPQVLAPLLAGEADLVLGNREDGMEPGALPAHARLGNQVALLLLWALFGRRLHDLPSFKAIRRADLLALGIEDLHYGWTAEMIARAARSGLRIAEVPIRYRVRVGESKVSGTLGGSLRAGWGIVWAILRARAGAIPPPAPSAAR